VQGQGQGLSTPASAADGQATRAGLVHERLVAAYGPHIWHPDGDPLDELIATILSQHTSDVNSARAFASLRQAFPTWQDVLAADDEAVAESIRSGGLAAVKAPRIRAMLASLTAAYGTPRLDFLRSLPTPDARQILEAIPGVGPKTAACVLLFCLGRPVIPVDTHVHRVARRIGLAPANASPDAVEVALEAEISPDSYYSMHVSLITHGRQTCKAQRPACERCPIADLCDYNGDLSRARSLPNEASGGASQPPIPAAPSAKRAAPKRAAPKIVRSSTR
jgi:endonuclease-3